MRLSCGYPLRAKMKVDENPSLVSTCSASLFEINIPLHRKKKLIEHLSNTRAKTSPILQPIEQTSFENLPT